MRGRGRINLTSSGSGSSPGANTKKIECSSSRVYKRTRTKEKNVVVDIISHLPDHILHHIFTFLDIKQAIQTCLLSKRWRYVWVSLPTLKFSYNQSRRRNKIRNEFMAFVDRVLMIRGNSNIHEFILVTDSKNIDVTDRLNTWILVCVHRNVQQLILDTHFPEEKFHFLHCLFTCKSLTKLVLKASYGRFSLNLSDSVTLPRLKTLSLDSVKFEDEYSTNQLFFGCPILESLVIKNCQFLDININISSSQLQHLVIENCRTGSDTISLKPVDIDIKFKVCAPNLISFYCDYCMSTCCDLKNLCSLVKVDIDVYVGPKWSKKEKAMYVPHMVNILSELYNVEDLTLSTSFLEVVRLAPDLLDSPPMRFCNLRRLKLTGTWHSIDYIHAVSYLLKISPKIEETLFKQPYDDKIGNAARDLLNMQPTQFCYLRCLKIHAVLSRNWIYVIAYLLKICPKIETLSFKINQNSSCSTMNPYCDEINSNSTKKRRLLESPDVIGMSLECLLNELKCFEILCVEGRMYELEFIEIVLKNAMLLEKLVIVFQKTFSVDAERPQIKFREKVLTFPRTSSSVVIMFK